MGFSCSRRSGLRSPVAAVVCVVVTVSTGLGFDGRNYLLIVGAWACPINDLRLHSSLSGCDLAMLTYAAKYLHKAAGADVVAGDLI